MIKKIIDVNTNINISSVENGFIGANFYTEDDGSAYIRITIKNNNEVLDFTKTDMLPRLDLFCSDGSIFTNEPIDIVYPEKGVIQYKVSDNVIQHAGKMDAKLFLGNKDDSVHVANFYFTISDSGMTGPIGKEVHVDSLKGLVEQVMRQNALGLLDDKFLSKVQEDLKTYVHDNNDLFKGVAGEKGDKGDKGDTGDTGPQGIQGIQGLPGKDGKNGIDGLDGKPGIDGIDGADGPKGEPFTYNDFTQEQLDKLKGEQGIAGPQGPVGPIGPRGPEGTIKFENLTEEQKNLLKGPSGESIINENAVTHNKTDFVKTGKNIFDPTDIEIGKIVSNTTGLLSDSSYYRTSKYLPVTPNTQYTQNYSDPIAFYDKNKQFISGLARVTSPKGPRTFTTPENAYFIKATTINEGIDTYSYKVYQIEKGNQSTSYEPFKFTFPQLNVKLENDSITNENVKAATLTLEKLSFTENTANLFNPNDVTTGYYVNPTTGALSTNANYVASNFIEITGATSLTKNNTFNLYAFYDSNKNYISNTNTSSNTITVPNYATYVRISANLSALNGTMLVKGQTLPTTFVEYKRYIPSKYLDLSSVTGSSNKVYEDSYGKGNLQTYTSEISRQFDSNATTRTEIAIIGDSWVQGGEFKAGDRLTLPLRDRMTKLHGDGGIGFIGFANNHAGNGYVSVNLIGNWTHYDEGLGNIAQSKGLDSAMVESSTVSDSIKVEFTEDIDYYEIHTLNTGQWRYNVDGGNWVTIDATSQEVTQIPLSLGKHVINIEIVSGKVTFVGSYAYKGKKGVVIHKIGNGGLRASHMASTDRANYIKQLGRCKANTFGILLGTNDMAGSVPIADYERDMKEVISRIKTAKPNASIFLIAPSGNNKTGTLHSIEDYSNKQCDIAKEMKLGHVSLYRNLGDFATTNANGLMFSDGVHPNKIGGYAISNVIYDRLLRI